MPRTTNAAGRIRDESLMNLGGRGKHTLINILIVLCDTNLFQFSSLVYLVDVN
jgi:hypothetical protein